MSVELKYIGTVHTPFSSKEGMPIQAKAASGVKGTVVLNNELTDGLSDIDGFSHIILIYHFHKSDGYKLKVTPFLDDDQRGVFSTRAPSRPNALGVSIVKLLGVRDNILEIEDVDILNGTPLLDIKPFIEEFDNRKTLKCGWFENNKAKLNNIVSDGRFSKNINE